MDKYVKRGSAIFDFSFLFCWEEELEEMNAGKQGRPYKKPDSFIFFLQKLRCLGMIPSRTMEGFVLSLKEIIPFLDTIDHTTLCRRVNRLKPDVFRNIKKSKQPTTVAIDSTGLKISRQGAWLGMKSKDNRKKKKKLYLKLHWAVDTRTGKVLELSATPCNVHDSEEGEKLLDGAGKRANVGKGLMDGSYDTKRMFEACRKRNIVPGIKVRKTAVPTGDDERSYWVRMASPSGLGYAGWFQKVGYGKRWAVETAYSVFKRSFGEDLLARARKNVLAEVNFKTWMYNEFFTD